MKIREFKYLCGSILGLLLIITAVVMGQQAPSSESRYGLTAFAGGGRYFPLGQTVVVGANGTNSTNVIIVPNDAYVPAVSTGGAVGSTPQITYLDAFCQSSSYAWGASGYPNVTYFFSTNQSAILSGNDATNNPRTVVLNSTNGTVYSTNATGYGSNAFWLTGVVPGVINGQWAVIKHQGIMPTFLSYEPAIITGSAVIYTTNTFTNGANQTTSLIGSNTAIVLQNFSQLANNINAGDQIWFQQTNYATLLSSNTVGTGIRYTQSSVGGISTGERGRPLMVIGFGTNMQMSLNANFLP